MSDLDALQGEVDRLSNAVAHLVRSNAELSEAMAESGRDDDFKLAIEENIVTIAKYRTNIEGLEKVLREARGEGVALTNSDSGGDGRAAAPREADAAGDATRGPEQGPGDAFAPGTGDRTQPSDQTGGAAPGAEGGVWL